MGWQHGGVIVFMRTYITAHFSEYLLGIRTHTVIMAWRQMSESETTMYSNIFVHLERTSSDTDQTVRVNTAAYSAVNMSRDHVFMPYKHSKEKQMGADMHGFFFYSLIKTVAY